MKKILLLVAIAIPSFFAGMRDYSIGTDRRVYGDDLFFDVVRSQDFFHLNPKWDGWIEKGYIYFNYIVSFFSDNICVFYFCLSFVTLFFVLLAFLLLGYRKYTGFAYAAYLFLFFQTSLNAMRQSLAASIALCAIALYMKRKYKWTILFFLLAYSMHTSTLIIVAVPIFSMAFQRRDFEWKKIILYSLILFLIMVAGGNIMNALGSFLDVENNRYSLYFDKANSMYSFFISSIEFLFRLSFVLIILNQLKSMYREFPYSRVMILFACFLVISSQISLWGGAFVSRMLMYFDMSVLFLYPLVLLLSPKPLTKFLLLSAYLVCYWYSHYIYANWNATYPYTSKLLGI